MSTFNENVVAQANFNLQNTAKYFAMAFEVKASWKPHVKKNKKVQKNVLIIGYLALYVLALPKSSDTSVWTYSIQL